MDYFAYFYSWETELTDSKSFRDHNYSVISKCKISEMEIRRGEHLAIIIAQVFL